MRGSGNEDKGYSEYIAQAKGTEKYRGQSDHNAGCKTADCGP